MDTRLTSGPLLGHSHLNKKPLLARYLSPATAHLASKTTRYSDHPLPLPESPAVTFVPKITPIEVTVMCVLEVQWSILQTCLHLTAVVLYTVGCAVLLEHPFPSLYLPPSPPATPLLAIPASSPQAPGTKSQLGASSSPPTLSP